LDRLSGVEGGNDASRVNIEVALACLISKKTRQRIYIDDNSIICMCVMVIANAIQRLQRSL